MTAFRLQDPDETLVYTFEWSPWLATGDSISSANFAISPTGPGVTDLGESGTKVSARIDSCTRGEVYRLTCNMVSANGETGQQSVVIRCDHK